MTTFRRGHSAREALARNRRAIEKIGQTLRDGIHITTTGTDPADTRTLRGIPAIGKGVAGVSPGTRPDAITGDHRADATT